MINLLSHLVKFDTQNAKQNETPLAKYIKKYLKPYASKIILLGKKRKNVVAFFGNLESKNILLLNGHMDTANTNKADWSTPPLKLTVKNNLAYGLGCADMKGGLAISMSALIECQKQNLLQNKCVIFAATVDEENGSSSQLGASLVASYLQKHNIHPTGCIINEPQPQESKHLRINVGHRGLLWLKVFTHGTTSHSGLMQKEDNAINKMKDFLTALQSIYTNQPTKINKIPTTSARALYINSGSPNTFGKVPALCECALDVRISPKDNITKVQNTITKLAQKFDAEVQVFKQTPSSCINEKHSIVKKILSSMQNLKLKGEVTYASPTCDAHHFNAIGIPTINGLGAVGKNVHSANEFIEISSLEQQKELFIEIIKNW